MCWEVTAAAQTSSGLTLIFFGVVFSTDTFSSFTAGVATGGVAGGDASVAVAFSSSTGDAAVAGSAS